MSMKECLGCFNGNIFLEKALGYNGWSSVYYFITARRSMSGKR